MTDIITGFKPKLCPECKSANLKKDYKRAELACGDCGFVLFNPVFNLTAPYLYQGISSITYSK
jgi:ribosomal protein S27AE